MTVEPTCYLSFCCPSEAAPALEAVIAAVQGALKAPMAKTHDAWGGNPRDGYQRWARGEVELPGADGTAPLRLRVELALEASRCGTEPEQADTSRVQVSLDGGDAAAVYRVWQALAAGLASAGYTDTTLAEAPAPLIDRLAAAGQVQRVRALRTQISVALAARVATAPAHWPIVVSFTRPDDFNRVIRAAPAPDQVTSISLTGCALTTLPEVLTERPPLFPNLTHLALDWNALESLPPLRASFPKLVWLSIRGNPPLRLARAQWRGVRVIRS